MDRAVSIFLRTLVGLVLFSTIAYAAKTDLAMAAQASGREVKPAAVNPSKQAWQEKWDATIAAAKKERSVVIYGEVFGDMRAQLDRGIKKSLGLEPDYVIAKSPEIAARYLKERDAGLSLADIIFAGQSTSLIQIKPKGVLTSPEPFLMLPEVLDTAAWPRGKLPFLDRDHHIVTLASSANSYIAVNSELVKKTELTSYRDLLNPRWKGKIVIFDPTASGAGSSWFAFMLLRVLGVEEGEKFMEQFVAQAPVVTRDGRLQVEQIAKGKFAIGVGTAHQVTAEFVKLGAPIEHIHMKEGTNMVFGSGCLIFPDKRPHPNAATAVVNWLLTGGGQTAFSQGFGSPAVRLGVTTSGMNPGVIAPPGAKLNWVDEDYIVKEASIRKMAPKLFAPVLR